MSPAMRRVTQGRPAPQAPRLPIQSSAGRLIDDLFRRPHLRRLEPLVRQECGAIGIMFRPLSFSPRRLAELNDARYKAMKSLLSEVVKRIKRKSVFLVLPDHRIMARSEVETLNGPQFKLLVKKVKDEGLTSEGDTLDLHRLPQWIGEVRGSAGGNGSRTPVAGGGSSAEPNTETNLTAWPARPSSTIRALPSGSRSNPVFAIPL